jgi:DNA-binding IclR family transcriptional regulator
VRATTIARYLEIPRETVRRYLMQLTKLELLQKDDGTFSAGERSQTTRRIELAVKSIQSAAAKLL